MGLTQAQKATIERVRAAGAGELGSGLTEQTCSYLIALIARDLGVTEHFPELLGVSFSEFFEEGEPQKLTLESINFLSMASTLFSLVENADTYFQCLGTLHKSRLKYSRILEYQPLPTMDQIGPRALLQYGQMESSNLAAWIFWRKWIYDIDNRAAQETGYLFQPIIASAIGGATFSSKSSPIRRFSDKSKGRQVDCVRDKFAYEIKIRVTIAASGQGRWQQELDFPVDCRASGYTPVLVVLDPTPNTKLNELISSFRRKGGEAYVGDEAWAHFEEAAGTVMSTFLEKYIRMPLQHVLASTPDNLPDLSLHIDDNQLTISIGKVQAHFPRAVTGSIRRSEESVHRVSNQDTDE